MISACDDECKARRSVPSTQQAPHACLTDAHSLQTRIECAEGQRGTSHTWRAARSEEAASLARSSRALPSSTQPSSMAGSSKKVGQPREGSPVATQLTAKLAQAPRATRLFMSGDPRQAATHPFCTMSLPGPAHSVFSLDAHPQQHTKRHTERKAECHCIAAGHCAGSPKSLCLNWAETQSPAEACIAHLESCVSWHSRERWRRTQQGDRGEGSVQVWGGQPVQEVGGAPPPVRQVAEDASRGQGPGGGHLPASFLHPPAVSHFLISTQGASEVLVISVASKVR